MPTTAAATAQPLAEPEPEPGTFSNDSALPPLPLPDLETTLERYLSSIRPLTSEAQMREAETAAAALLAEGGAGRRLHAALAARAADADNWLADWWDNVAYLDYPEPLLITSNFGISCDARQPADDPCLRAAEVSARTIDFYAQLTAETWPPETVGRAKIPLDMSLMGRILGATRAPGRERDQVVVYPPEAARHIIALRKNRLYPIEVMDGRGRTVSTADLAERFRAVLTDADARAVGDPAPAVAALTTERRPVWALERERLMSDPINRQSLARIESAIFLVAFDDDAYDDFNSTARSAMCGRPGSRWMDKVYSYVVDAAGRVSQHGEHSPADGMQFVTVFDHGCDPSQRGVFRALPEETERRAGAATVAPLEWRLSTESRAAIAAAGASFETRVGDLDLEVLQFDDFGKGVIKTLGVGPDPFLQMGYQLAFHRRHGRAPKTYESAQTRMFKRGRTETIRTASVESKAFAEAMDDSSLSDAERAARLRAACDVHAERGKLASQGQGVDRHLLGLALIAGEMGEAVPALATQEIWSRGWELSTAQLPMKGLLVNGFGPVTPEGYGIGYVIQDGSFTCHITSFRSHPETSSVAFAEALRRAFSEMRTLLEAHPAG